MLFINMSLQVMFLSVRIIAQLALVQLLGVGEEHIQLIFMACNHVSSKMSFVEILSEANGANIFLLFFNIDTFISIKDSFTAPNLITKFLTDLDFITTIHLTQPRVDLSIFNISLHK